MLSEVSTSTIKCEGIDSRLVITSTNSSSMKATQVNTRQRTTASSARMPPRTVLVSLR